MATNNFLWNAEHCEESQNLKAKCSIKEGKIKILKILLSNSIWIPNVISTISIPIIRIISYMQDTSKIVQKYGNVRKNMDDLKEIWNEDIII